MFEPDERAYLKDMEAIAVDEQGREVLIGLTYEETEEYMRLTRRKPHTDDERARYLELNDRHERERIGAIGAKYERRH